MLFNANIIKVTCESEGEAVFFSAKRWDRRNRADLIESATPCHDAQVVGPYRDSNPLRLTVLAAMSVIGLHHGATTPSHAIHLKSFSRFVNIVQFFWQFSMNFHSTLFGAIIVLYLRTLNHRRRLSNSNKNLNRQIFLQICATVIAALTPHVIPCFCGRCGGAIDSFTSFYKQLHASGFNV